MPVEKGLELYNTPLNTLLSRRAMKLYEMPHRSYPTGESITLISAPEVLYYRVC